jgi:hypothetical protein
VLGHAGEDLLDYFGLGSGNRDGYPVERLTVRSGEVGQALPRHLSRTDGVADLLVELPALTAVPGACFFAFASLSFGGSGTFFSAIMT